MNVRIIATAALLLLNTGTLAAQAVLKPDPILPPEKQVVNDAVYALRDSLLLVDAAGSRIARDRAQASDASLQSRARLLADRCRSSVQVSDSTRSVIASGKMPAPDPRGFLTRIDKSIGELRTRLVWCEGEFTRLAEPANATELRGYGIGRAAQVTTAVASYVAEARIYLNAALGVRYRPNTRGAGAVTAGSPRT